MKNIFALVLLSVATAVQAMADWAIRPPSSVGPGVPYSMRAYHRRTATQVAVIIYKNGAQVAGGGNGAGVPTDLLATADYSTADAGPNSITYSVENWSNASGAWRLDGTNGASTSVPANTPPVPKIEGPDNLGAGTPGTWNFSVNDTTGNLKQWRFYYSTNPSPRWSNISGGYVAGSYGTSLSPGSYTFVLDVEDLSGATASFRFNVIVRAAPATFTVNGPFTYNGSLQTVTITPSPSNATFTSGGTTQARGVGTYTATAAANGSFTGSNSNLGWSIVARPITFRAPSGSKVYNGSGVNLGSPSVTSGSLASGHSVSFSGNTSSVSASVGTTTTSVGIVSIRDSTGVDVTSNYSITRDNGSYSITKAPQDPPVVLANQSFVPGNSYTASASGGGGFGSLEWTLGTGSSAPGAAITSSGVVSASGPGTVLAKARWTGDLNHFASSDSPQVAITILPGDAAPVITQQPQSQNLARGDRLSLSVAATGSPTPTFQWQKDDVDIPGATAAMLERDPVDLRDAGIYTVVVRNRAGSAVSSAALINVDARDNLSESGVDVNLSIVGCGSGEATLTIGGNNHRFVFESAAGTWSHPLAPRMPDLNRTISTVHSVHLGAVEDVQVSAPPEFDFIVTATVGAAGPAWAGGLQVECGGAYANAIRKSELKAGRFSLRVLRTGSVPFGMLDTSALEVNRVASFGLGGGAGGLTAGRIGYAAQNFVVSSGGETFFVEKGPAMIDSWGSLGSRFQAKVPAGFVDVQRIGATTTIRYFSPADHGVAGGHDFSNETPLVTYTVTGNLASSGSITRQASGVASVLEYQAGWQSTLDGQSEPKRLDNAIYRTRHETLKSVIRFWPWRRVGKPRLGLTVVSAVAPRLGSAYDVSGNGNYTWNYAYEPTNVYVKRYAGTTEESSVLAIERHDFSPYDFFLLSGKSLFRGVAEHLAWKFVNADNPNLLSHAPSLAVNATGGETVTEYFSYASVLGRPSNFEGESLFAAGEPKIVKTGFLNGTAADADALVSTYRYTSDLIDGKALPRSVVTKQGSTTIGEVTYVHTLERFNTLSAVKTVATRKVSSNTSLTTTTKAFSRRLADPDLRSKPISVVNPDGTKTSYGYLRFGDSLVVVELNGKDGAGVNSFKSGASTLSIDPLTMDPGRSIATERTINAQGRLKREATHVYGNNAEFTLLNAVDFGYDDLGNLISKTDSSGRILYAASFTGFRKDSETDEQGIKLTYTYNDYDRVETMTRAAATSGEHTVRATTNTYTYDEAGRLKTDTLSAAGTTENLKTEYNYDTADRPTSRTLFGTSAETGSSGPLVTSINYPSQTQTTTTFPGGGTKIETTYKDGRPCSTSGDTTPDVATRFSYNASGQLETKQVFTATGSFTSAGSLATTPGARYVLTRADWVGRTVATETPTFGAAGGSAPGSKLITDVYTGALLTSRTHMSGGEAIAPAQLFSYDPYARLWREAVDINNNGVIDLASDYEIKEYESAITSAPSDNSHLYRYDAVKVWPYDGTNASAARYASQSYSQVTGLGATTVAHTIAIDFDQNHTDSTSTVDWANATLSTSATVSGSAATVRRVTLNGVLVESTNAQGQTTSQKYDSLGRLSSVIDPRTGASVYAYYTNSTQVKTLTAPDTKKTSYTIDGAGRVASQSDNAGKTANFRYDAAGNLTRQWGDTVSPAKYVFNDLGQKIEMQTYRTGTFPAGFENPGDKTTWSYQPATGLLWAKLDASNPATTYAYNARGQVSNRTDGRGWVTNYVYDDARKLLSKVDYTGTAAEVTTDIIYGYDRAGRKQSVTDALGTRAFVYYDSEATAGTLFGCARLKSETLPSGYGGQLEYTYQFGTVNRANGSLSGLKRNSSTFLAYGYDELLRLNSVTFKGGTPFNYTYVPLGNRIDKVMRGAAAFRDYDYENDLPGERRVASDRLAVVQHAWGSSTSAIESRLTYNSRGLRDTEKTQGAGWMAALNRGSEAGVHADYTYTDRYELESSGKYILGSDWSIGAERPVAAREFEYDAMGNRSTQDSLWQANSLNQVASAPNFGTFSYDENGNLLSDGNCSYAYDAENRLIKVTQGNSVWNYRYDYLGRRIEKSGTGIATTRFLYDGWNLIAELNGSGTIRREFGWGLDVSGTLQGAGGVGGLLAIQDNGLQHLPVYDASHNVIALYDGNGAFSASYEYDPFGNLQTMTGSYGAANPFRSATKYTDDETGLVYYGMRYYSPQLGRFINRDPIEETGGLNLYAFCGNDGVNRYDDLGMEDVFDQIRRTGGVSADGPGGATYSRDNPMSSTLFGSNPERTTGEYFATHDDRGRLIQPNYFVTDIQFSNEPAGVKAGVGSVGAMITFWRTVAPNSELLVGIDGTDSARWRETDPTTGRAKNSHVFNMVRDFKGSKRYFDGPNTPGTNVGLISARALAFIHAQLRENPNLVVNLIGYSRGGLIAIDLARQLKSGFADVNGGAPVRVNFLGLFDAVDRAIGMSGSRITNVDSVLHVVRDPAGGSRGWFGNTGLQADADVRYMEVILMGTHSAMGGGPGGGDFNRTNIPLVQETMASQQANQWMRAYAGLAGLSF